MGEFVNRYLDALEVTEESQRERFRAHVASLGASWKGMQARARGRGA